MSVHGRTAVRLAMVVAMTVSSSIGVAGVTDGPPDAPRTGLKPPPTRSLDHPTGAPESNSRGAVSGSMTTTPQPEKEQQRGNTPPGKDREGHGPAAGAIVDPSGAASGRKPF
jgi:hypothetical protein